MKTNHSLYSHSLLGQQLIDVTETARKAGIPYPVSMTNSVFRNCVCWGGKNKKRVEQERLWDILILLFVNISLMGHDNGKLVFEISCELDRSDREITLISWLKKWNQKEDSIVIMFPNQITEHN